MTERKVKETIGTNNWQRFCEWMRGQTCGVYPDGTTNYYECDVDAFKRKITTGYDRQKDPMAWD